MEFTRIKDKGTGAEFTYDDAKLAVLDEAGYEVLDRPALDANGDPVPAKYRTTKSGQRAATTNKEK